MQVKANLKLKYSPANNLNKINFSYKLKMLKDFYIGDSYEYITVEYANSGRAACKKCKEKIGMEELRVGILVDDDHFSTGQGTQWFHQACFHFKPRHKVLELEGLNKKIHNLETLNKKDQKTIISYLKA